MSYELGSYLSSLNTKLEEIRQQTERINERIYYIEKYVQQLTKNITYLENELKAVASELSEIKSRVDYLENELKETRRELNNRIDGLENEVIKVKDRVDEVEENLDQHLTKQDTVLQRNSEALLNNLAMQFVVNVVSKMGSSAHVVLGHLNEKPFIVIESSNHIYMVLISIEISEEDVKTLENIKDILKEYSDKEVKYNILTTDVSKAKAPAWLYSLQ